MRQGLLRLYCMVSMCIGLTCANSIVFAGQLHTLKDMMDKHAFRVHYSLPQQKIEKTALLIYDSQNIAQQSIISTTFLDAIKATNSTVQGVYINSSILNDVTYLNENTIQDDLTIYLSQFNRPLDVKYTGIKGAMNIYGSIFADRLNCSFSRVEGPTVMSSNVFHGPALFLNASFLDKSYVVQSLFQKEVNFAYAAFMDETAFIGNSFFETVIFDGALFSKKLSFHGSVFHKDVRFDNALLPHYVDFSNVRIMQKNINLKKAKPSVVGDRILLNILGTDPNKIDFDYIAFKLFFPKTTTHQQKVYIYSLLLKKFDKLGMTRSYEALFREFREYKLLYDNHYIINNVDKYWWDYGLNKDVVYYWFLSLFIFLTLVNCLFYDVLVSKYFDIRFLKKTESNVVCDINPILNYMQNIARATLLTLFFAFATFLQVLTNEKRIFKSDKFLINAYAIALTFFGYIFILFVFESLINST